MSLNDWIDSTRQSLSPFRWKGKARAWDNWLSVTTQTDRYAIVKHFLSQILDTTGDDETDEYNLLEDCLSLSKVTLN